MSDHADAKSHEKLYWMVGGALFVLTIATVLVSKYHIPHPWNYVVGIAIAVLKASLVVSIFMHLKWESRLIYYVLGITAFFAVFLFVLPIVDFSWTTGQIIHRADPAGHEAVEHH
ncbi:MAG: cytochrome C oxidase subunit IV family protein [Elusimicrobia bacterium]|nr:cytochrome C oxidase subunit IV family protein [Elusimicrobiota bacterium]